MRRNLITAAAVMMLAISTSVAKAQEDIGKVETLTTGLSNPAGIAIQPKSGHIFIADSEAKRIVKIDPAKPKEIIEVITDFPVDVYGKGPKYNIGPLGLAFIDQNTLVVGGGGYKDGEELVRIYTLPADGKKIKASEMKQKLGPVKPNGDIKGEGNFYGIAVTPTGIYATSNGDDTKGWLVRAEIKDKKIGELKRWLPTKEKVEVDAPVAITINEPKGHIVVGQMGEITVPGDGLLTFYSARTGKMLLNLETGLSDITALAYSPAIIDKMNNKTTKEKLLYAADFAWAEPDKGGIYRIDDDTTKEKGKGVKIVKVATVMKPTAMVYHEGALYVTAFGKPDGKNKTGVLLKITGKKDSL